jgi:hypothetical protein
MKKTTLAAALSSLAISALFVTASGCVTSSEPVDEASAGMPAPYGVRVMKIQDPNLQNESKAVVNQAGSAKTLTYYGGPVLQNVSVHPVFWNSTVANQSQLNAFTLGSPTAPTSTGSPSTTPPRRRRASAAARRWPASWTPRPPPRSRTPRSRPS